MTPYVDFDPSGDMTVRDADTSEVICYLPQTCSAAGVSAAKRRKIERLADAIVAGLKVTAK